MGITPPLALSQVTPMYRCIIWAAANHSFTQLNYQITMMMMMMMLMIIIIIIIII